MPKASVLITGIDPVLIDFSDPAYAAFPGLTPEKVTAGLKAEKAHLESLGYDIDNCFVDFGETAESVLRDCLSRKAYDCVLIGAGVRLVPQNTALLEKLVNTVHQHAPKAKFCFNTKPTDSVEAIQRVLPAA